MEVIYKKNAEEIGIEVGDIIADLVKAKPNSVLGLATGSSPIDTYNRIVERAEKEKIDFSRVVTFNLDEYVDCGDETQTYRRFMDEHLFNRVNINKANTHFPDAAHPEKYDEEIAKAGGVDLQLLGIGANGHIGFNEPNTPFNSKTHIVELTEKTRSDNARFFKSLDDVPTKAVTMGLSTITKARKIILIATGINKSAAIALMCRDRDVSCPASVLKDNKNAAAYCDEAAAKYLL